MRVKFVCLHTLFPTLLLTTHSGVQILPQMPPGDQSYAWSIYTSRLLSIFECNSMKFCIRMRNSGNNLWKVVSACCTKSERSFCQGVKIWPGSAFVCTWCCPMRRPSGDTWIKASIEALEQHVTAALASPRQKSSVNCSLMSVTGGCKGSDKGHTALLSHHLWPTGRSECVRSMPPLCYLTMDQIIAEKKCRAWTHASTLHASCMQSRVHYDRDG